MKSAESIRDLLFMLIVMEFFFSSQESPESLLRSALQGKGYAKTLHSSQNGITVIPAQNSVKDEELRRALFTNEQVRD